VRMNPLDAAKFNEDDEGVFRLNEVLR